MKLSVFIKMLYGAFIIWVEQCIPVVGMFQLET